MFVKAPGKLLFTGAYAVLEGAPAVVVAVDRYAVADTEHMAPSSRAEIQEAFGEAPSPRVTTDALMDGEQKLGLGSSAAALVATMGARAAARGNDLQAAETRQTLFRDAYDAHARAQKGGSGVDVAASTFGGALRYALGASGPILRPVALPAGFEWTAFFSGVSARTSDLRARVDALRARNAELYRRRMSTLCDAAERACLAVDAKDTPAFLTAIRANAGALAALGRDADVPIVPPAFASLATLAARDGAVFQPSGAGGGDVGIHFGTSAPHPDFLRRAAELGFRPLLLQLEHRGVHKVA